MSKVFILILFIVQLPLTYQAQALLKKARLLRPSAIEYQYRNLENSYNTHTLKLGTPPVFWGTDRKNFFNLSTGYSILSLRPRSSSQNINLQKISLAPFYRRKLKSDWTFLTALPFSLAREMGSSPFNSRGLSLVGILSWNKKGETFGSSYGFGLITIKLAQRVLVFPNISYQYTSKDLDWVLSLRFPRLSLDRVFYNFVVGCFVGIDFETYLLAENSKFPDINGATYFNSQRVIFGLSSHFPIFRTLHATIDSGVIINERLYLSDDSRDQLVGSSIYRSGSESFFSSLTLGLKF